MADSKKYYYLKLKDNFFESEEIKLLEKLTNGYKYSNILLKLYLKSLKSDGRLMFKDRIPYNEEMIATITNHDVDIVRQALKVFKEFNLIEILDNGAIYMLDIQNFIGESSTEADRKRLAYNKMKQEQKLLSGDLSEISPPEIEIEKEIEIKKEIDNSEQVAKPTEKNSDALSEILESEDFEQELKDKIILWLQYKKEKKSGYKPTGFKVFLKDVKKSVEKHGKDYTLQRFDYSMSKNYQGVFFETSDKQVKVEQESEYKRRMKNDTSGFYG